MELDNANLRDRALFNPAVSELPKNAFAALAELLTGIVPPEGEATLNVAVGDPQGHCPVPLNIIAERGGSWGRYPPLIGTDELRTAILGWLSRRFVIGAQWVHHQLDVLPTAGTREALFLAAVMAVPKQSHQRPAVLLPNPSYPGYVGSAIMAGAEPIFVAARPENGHMPDFESLDTNVLNRTALVYFTNPTNPEGAAAPADYLARLIKLSERYGFILVVDECCIDLYTREAPVGVLSVCERQNLSTERLLVFNSLSKRSLSAGLRSGFAVGNPNLISTMRVVRSYTGATIPIPLQAASATLWADDEHVCHIRRDLDEKMTLAEAHLEDRFGRVRPDGGFFLWLRVNDDLAVAKRLWARGLKVMPGSLLGHGSGFDNPAQDHIRIAVVHETREFERLIALLTSLI